MKSGKKLVYVPEDVLDLIAEICRKNGMTISRFIEDALRQAVKLKELGYDLRRAADILEIVRTQKVLGGAFMPQDVLNFMVEGVYNTERERLLKQSMESGKLYGRYLKERFKDPVVALKNFLEVTRWDLSEVNATSDGDVYRLRCISTVLSAEGTELLAKFIEGVVDGFGCEVLKVDFIKGIIVIEFRSI